MDGVPRKEGSNRAGYVAGLMARQGCWNLVLRLRTVLDEWKFCEGHLSRNQFVIGLARWATCARKWTVGQTAAQTAQRFAGV
jgi:hypothetical protein